MNIQQCSETQYIGIIADGSTDLEVISRFSECILESSIKCESIQMKFSFRDSIDKYKQEASSNDHFGLFDQPALDLRRSIITILHSSIKEFQNLIPRPLKSNDLLVLNSDSESVIRDQDAYFEQWALVLTKIFYTAIEEFYHISRYNFTFAYVPLILPLVLFPSTDILIAALKYNGGNFTYHDKKPRELKRILYGVENLRQLSEDEFKRKALDFIDLGTLDNVYTNVPESRLFLKSIGILKRL